MNVYIGKTVCTGFGRTVLGAFPGGKYCKDDG
jgi:hypothetical protein